MDRVAAGRRSQRWVRNPITGLDNYSGVEHTVFAQNLIGSKEKAGIILVQHLPLSTLSNDYLRVGREERGR